MCLTGRNYPHGLRSEWVNEGNEIIFSALDSPEYLPGGAMRQEEDFLGRVAAQYVVWRDLPAHA